MEVIINRYEVKEQKKEIGEARVKEAGAIGSHLQENLKNVPKRFGKCARFIKVAGIAPWYSNYAHARE